jgi:histidinol dehydrogenase
VLAYGTQTVPKVDKIFGSGNQWVTAAKILVQNDTDALVAIDMPAGPSEVFVSLTAPFHHVIMRFPAQHNSRSVRDALNT